LNAELKTCWRVEILAGFTTFLTMAYIVFVNPTILGGAGMLLLRVGHVSELLVEQEPPAPVLRLPAHHAEEGRRPGGRLAHRQRNPRTTGSAS
jgi:hypothetical protein